MINKVRLIETPKHAFNFLIEWSRNKQVGALRKRLEEGIEFTPGINILIGENGCGKSTVLNIIRSANRIEHSSPNDVTDEGMVTEVKPLQ